jgi:hypothetical protein
MAKQRRRSNPSGEKIALYAVGAVAVGVAGYFAIKAMKKPAADAAPGTGGGTGGGTLASPSSTLPTFDPKNTDLDHAYVIAVNTQNPVTDDQVPDPHTVVLDYLTNTQLGITKPNPITQLRVYGPVTKADKLDPTTLSPKPDLVIVASLAGDTLMALSQSQIAQLTKAP